MLLTAKVLEDSMLYAYWAGDNYTLDKLIADGYDTQLTRLNI
jgi:hypothetical protein